MALFEAQPAYKIYAFDRGWRIIRYVTDNLFKRTDVAARWWFGKGKDVLSWGNLKGSFLKYWSYVVMAGMMAAGGVQYVTAMIMATLFVTVQSILLALWAAVCILAIGLLFVCTFAYSRFYRIFYRCPDCHKDMDIPTFICPTCAVEHTQLWPSIYGILTHRCKTCESRLPTLRLKVPGLDAVAERDKLNRICPHCRTPINAGIGTGTNIHIPIVGGPSAGKSNYIVMATKAFKELYEGTYRYSISFTDPNHERDYTESVNRLSAGRELMKTTEIVAHAFNLKIKAPRALVPKLAYIYDVGGEAYEASQNTQMQEYYKYIHGIIFVIDPFAIADYAHHHQEDVERYQLQIRPSGLDIMEAYERMVQMFEGSVGLRRGKRFDHPIAIVVTKVDALKLEQEIGSSAARMLMIQDPSLSEEEAINRLVREFLNRYGLDHFVRDIEMQFSRVRYFSCSALGRMPDPMDSRPFVPMRVAEPLLWLLNGARAITLPQAQKTRKAAPEAQVMRLHSSVYHKGQEDEREKRADVSGVEKGKLEKKDSHEQPRSPEREREHSWSQRERDRHRDFKPERSRETDKPSARYDSDKKKYRKVEIVNVNKQRIHLANLIVFVIKQLLRIKMGGASIILNLDKRRMNGPRITFMTRRVPE